MSESVAFWLTIIVFGTTYLGLALGGFPGLRIDRTGIALTGAAAVLGCRLLTFDEAVQSVDFATIVLLLGMMIVVEYLRRAAFFDILAGRALAHVHQPSTLLAVVMLLSGVLSALLVNDVVCLALTPLVLHVTRHLKIDPKPHLIGLAIASNVGSTATLTGNPQNMIIGGLSQISYLRFAAKLAPIAIVGLVVSYLITLVLFRSALKAGPIDYMPQVDQPAPMHSKKKLLLIKSLIVTSAAVALFFAGAPMAIVALGAAAVLLLDRVKPEKIYHRVDWGLLVMFAGLFVVVHAFEVHVMRHAGVDQWTVLRTSPIAMLSVASAVLSNMVSNVPAVLLFKPIIPDMPSAMQETAWLALAMSSTLAGNLTLLGSVANLIVVEKARKSGVIITLADYCRAGVPITLVTLLIGMAWLAIATY
ncbi:MAG: anion transporter [Schlesneria sp.]|nr:anion transporter [Schlesneria sp.]